MRLIEFRCEVDPTKIAIWYSESLFLRLSGEAAGVLAQEGKLDLRNLKPLRKLNSPGHIGLNGSLADLVLGAREYATRNKARDPISGGSLAVMHIVQNHYASVAQIFYDPPKGVLNTMFSVPQGKSFLTLYIHALNSIFISDTRSSMKIIS